MGPRPIKGLLLAHTNVAKDSFCIRIGSYMPSLTGTHRFLTEPSTTRNITESTTPREGFLLYPDTVVVLVVLARIQGPGLGLIWRFPACPCVREASPKAPGNMGHMSKLQKGQPTPQKFMWGGLALLNYEKNYWYRT